MASAVTFLAICAINVLMMPLIETQPWRFLAVDFVLIILQTAVYWSGMDKGARITHEIHDIEH